MTATSTGTRRHDALIAGALAGVMSAAWSVRDRVRLTALALPDTDDAMRLQQVRDWLAGQPFADLAQHRLGDGVAMHWSRLADLAPALVTATLSPLLGRHDAEVAAVILVPALLFAATLFLVARLARRLDPALAPTATLVAAVAYPATSLFLPGRIDHHGLQMVLLLIAARAAFGGAGLVAGVAAAASLTIGLETAPLLALVGVLLVLAWIKGIEGAGRTLARFGAGASVALLAAAVLLRPLAWDYPACDGFTRQSWAALQLLAAMPVLVVVAGRRCATPASRLVLASIVGGAAIATALVLAPGCLSPYGAVDPVLARLWLTRVGEAQPLWAAAPAVAIGYAGVSLAGLAAALAGWRHGRDLRWLAVAALIAGALLLACVQIRGAYAGALFAALPLAGLIARARARSPVALAAAWIASAGMLYPLAGALLFPARGAATGGGDCASPRALAALAALPPARTLAPLDLGPAIIARTRGTAIAGPYHRNAAGNRAAFAFFLGDERAAADTVRAWRVERVLACPGMFADTAAVGTLALRLPAGRPPSWLRPEARLGDGLISYRPELRLSAKRLPR